jgi:hypothetical protein
MKERGGSSRTPAWVLFLLGVCALRFGVEFEDRVSAGGWRTGGVEVPDAVRRAAAEFEVILDPGRMGPRELRRLPGIGRRRAVEVLEFLERRKGEAGGLAWSDVHGIGPLTEERIHAWLRERGREDLDLRSAPAGPVGPVGGGGVGGGVGPAGPAGAIEGERDEDEGAARGLGRESVDSSRPGPAAALPPRVSIRARESSPPPLSR